MQNTQDIQKNKEAQLQRIFPSDTLLGTFEFDPFHLSIRYCIIYVYMLFFL